MGELHAKFVWGWVMAPLTGAAAWSYQPAEARTAAGSRYPRAPRPGPPVPPVPSALVGRAVLSWLAPTLPRNRYKILPAQLLGGENGIKLSLHAEQARNWAISGEQGEFCTGHAVRRGVRGEFCTGHAARTGVQGEFCTGYAARAGVQGEFCTGSVPRSSCWESFVPKGPGVVVVGRIMSCSGVVLVPVAGL